MRRPRPHLPPRPGGLPLPSQPASQPSPDQAHIAIMTARPHFAEIQISQNPTGWAPQRSLAPRTCRDPLPVCSSPSQSLPITRSPGCPPPPNVAEDLDTTVRLRAPLPREATFPILLSSWTTMPGNRHDGTYCDILIRDMVSPTQLSIPALRREAHPSPRPTSSYPCALSVRTDSDDLGARSYFLDDGFDASTPGLFFLFSSPWQICTEFQQS